MAESHKVEVEPMIAYEFSEDANVDLDDVPLSDPKHLDYNYDPALAKDKCFRFLLGTGMVCLLYTSWQLWRPPISSARL